MESFSRNYSFVRKLNMWYARKRGEAAERVTGSCRKKFSNIIPKGRPIRTAGRPNRPAVPRRVKGPNCTWRRFFYCFSHNSWEHWKKNIFDVCTHCFLFQVFNKYYLECIAQKIDDKNLLFHILFIFTKKCCQKMPQYTLCHDFE